MTIGGSMTAGSAKETPIKPEEELNESKDQGSIGQEIQHMLDTNTAITKEQRAALRAAKAAVKKGQWVEAIRLLLPWLGTAATGKK